MKEMNDLRIEVAQNGFVVMEGNRSGLVGKVWAFESVYSLSKFILEWGDISPEAGEDNP